MDTYYGNIIDHGFEIVHINEVPVWSMSYRGGMTNTLHSSHNCFSFLIKALAHLPACVPIRGPEFFCDSGYIYKSFTQGELFDFIGYEEIYFDTELIYYKKYMGGIFNSQIIQDAEKNYNTAHLILEIK